MMDFRRVAVSRPGAIRKSFEDHKEIVAALHARDAPAVIAAFERHINRIYTTTKSLIGRRDNGHPGVSDRASPATAMTSGT